MCWIRGKNKGLPLIVYKKMAVCNFMELSRGHLIIIILETEMRLNLGQ